MATQTFEQFLQTLPRGRGAWAGYYQTPTGYTHESDISSLQKLYGQAPSTTPAAFGERTDQDLKNIIDFGKVSTDPNALASAKNAQTELDRRSSVQSFQQATATAGAVAPTTAQEQQIKGQLSTLQEQLARATAAGYGPGGQYYGQQIPDYILKGETAPLIQSSTPSVVDSTTARAKTAQQIIDEAKAAQDLAKKQTDEIASLTRSKTIADLKTALGIDTGIPVKPTLVSDFEALRSEKGIQGLENQINAINTQISDTQASLRLGSQAQEGRLAPMELIGTRQLELQRQGTEQLDALNRRKATLVDEYNTKTNLVSTIMNLKSQDYANSVSEYNTKFSQVIQLQNLLATDEQKAQAQANVVADNARANLTVMVNLAQEAGGMLNMSEDFKATFAKEALKAGISVDSISAFLDAKPKAKLLSTTTWTDAQNNKNVTYIYEDPSNPGRPGAVEVVPIGKEKTTEPSISYKDAWDMAESNLKDNVAAGNTSPSQMAELYSTLLKEVGNKLSDSDIKSLMSKYGMTNYYGTWVYVPPPPATMDISKSKPFLSTAKSFLEKIFGK